MSPPFGNFKIFFNKDVITTSFNDLNVTQFLILEVKRGDKIFSAPMEYLVYDVKAVDF